MSNAPQNPYGSFALSASAGCGKTYQLSHRFLYLVGAGAKPGDILAITFTKKAASEMAQRIIAEASELLHDRGKAAAFDRQLQDFYEGFKANAVYEVAPPRDAQETAKLVLASTQQLRITTIDSTFWEWVRKFPWEASGATDDTGAVLPSGFELLDRQEANEIDEAAFSRLAQKLFVDQPVDLPETFFAQGGLFGLKNRFDNLASFTTYLWLQRRLRDDAAPLNPFVCEGPVDEDTSNDAFLGLLREPLQGALSVVKPELADEVMTLFAEGDPEALLASKIFTKTDQKLSGTYFRGKKKEEVAAEMEAVNALVAGYVNRHKLAHLNRFGHFLLELFHGYTLIRDEMKYTQSRVEFDDLARGCYRLFHEMDAIGARFLINQTTRHLLLDEFQDTSRLQWSVFSPLARELLAGEGGHSNQTSPPPSVFVVGDVKQSIYGFREADPRVLHEAVEELSPFGLAPLPLNESYRTAPSIMSFVNDVFTDLITEFPPHATAKNDAGEPVSPDCGWIQASPLLAAEDDETAAEREARFLADFFEQALQEPDKHPVYDKQLKGYRPLAPRDCVILFRNSTRAHLYESALRERGIACLREQTDGFYHRQEIKDLMALVRWLAHPSDLQALTQVLVSPLCTLRDEVLLAGLETVQDPERTQWQKALDLLAHLADQGEAAGPFLQELMQEAQESTPAMLFERLYAERAYPDTYRQAFGPGEGDLAAANAVQFLELLFELSSEGVTPWGQLDRTLQERAELGQLGNAPTSSNAVTLMTIHKSKGLEYPLVVLADAASPWEKRDPYWVKGEHAEHGMGIYYTGTSAEHPVRHATFEQVHARIDAQLREESYRLLYVALTRARQYLMVTGHEPTRKTKQALVGGFLAQVRSALAAGQGEDTNDTLCLDFRQSVTWAPEPAQPAAPPAPAPVASHPLGEIYSVRPSDTDASKAKTGAAEVDQEAARLHGLLVHSGLEAHIKDEPWQPAALWQTFRPLPGYTERLEAMLPDAEQELQSVLQSDTFQALRDKGHWQAEVPFCALLNGNQLVRGRLDLVVACKEEYMVIDYKTSREAHTPSAYQSQLANYCAAWRQMQGHHDRPTRGYVWFTHTNEILPVDGKENSPD